MANTPPASPMHPQRPASTIIKPSRSSSRMSISTKGGIGSRASDEESRTAVRVAVRIRPPLKSTDPGFELIPQRFQRSMVQTTSDTSLSIDSPQGRKLFVFDRVFGPDVVQEGIWDYLADSVDAFTQGYNVSLLAYGQSGAGKSYTMGTSGPLDQQDTEVMGVVPRAATALFDKLESIYGKPQPKHAHRSSLSHFKSPRSFGQPNALGDRNWSLKATYVEIYNEQLRDLLLPESTPTGERTNVAIREDTKGNILLTGLHQVDINSVEDMMNALNFGSSIRQTDSTAINAKSSRSHAVFSLNLIQKRSKFQTNGNGNKRHSMPIEAMTGQEVSVTTDSKLHFVDLAGSERLKNTGAQGERAKEGISINAGLASLGKVISQLSSRNAGSYVSYRDSKLTRLLQDSLGGNAITYMIACVTQAEFHLSETLNTVQYAQRARAIQSKPQIQQVEEGDKQAVIDRLKAEVSFLREQIRSAQDSANTPRSGNAPSNERTERDKERETELQDQLLDMQENYSALSQRHARLIGELAKAGDKDSAESAREQSEEAQLGDATDRQNRSNSFAQAVEQVVLEYEKTIESLEQSLSSTRTTLSNTETTLLEKETKCAYVETINTQMQSRLQKLVDRENSTENYLRDLETKLDGHTSGDEKNATIIVELRKEIVRIRENESSCEDYISTLEERLAEADQDSELMQREIDRLEQLVERQRSLGKLDSLLYELDNVEETKPVESEASGIPMPASRRNVRDHSRKLSHMSRHSQIDEAIPEADEASTDRANSRTSTVKEEVPSDQDKAVVADAARPVTPNGVQTNGDEPFVPQSPAQTRAVADKLETVTQELVGLRVEHESTMNQYDTLQAKYEEAMRTVAQLQDTIDENRHATNGSANATRDSVISTTSAANERPSSYMSDKAVVQSKEGPRSSASRSLSSELSSAMESAGTMDTSDDGVDVDTATSEDDTATTKPAVSSSDDELTQSQQQELEAEVASLKAMAAERDAAEKELAEKYAQLESEHSETLDMVEELKTDLSKARAIDSGPRNSSPVIRRKSSQNLLIIDRAHRSFASLRNIASDNFEEKPEVMQNFELNLNSAMHELHSRSERIQELEAAHAATKKEMETKMTIISGLTRERTSLKASPMDITMVATLRQKLEQHEKQLDDMRNAHDSREQELLTELESLRATAASNTVDTDGAAEGTREIEAGEADAMLTAEHERKVADLQTELSAWEDKHQAVLNSMGAVETELRANIAQLETELSSTASALEEAKSSSTAGEQATKELEDKHQNLVAFLRSEIDEYKGIIQTNSTKVTELENGHATTRSELANMKKSHEAAIAEATRQEGLVAELQAKLDSFEETSKSHEGSLTDIKSTHAKELAELKAHEQKGYEEQVEVLLTEHSESIRKLETEVTDAREDLMKVATQVAVALGLDVSIEKLTERIDGLVSDKRSLTEEQNKALEMKGALDELTVINEKIMTDLDEAKNALTDLLVESDEGAPPSTIKEHIAGVKSKMVDLEGRNKKHSRLVEELEEQLQNNFDEAQMTNKRLSTLQTERAAQLDEANAARTKLQADLDSIRQEYNSLQTKLQDANGDVQRSNSNSTIRKSASHNSLPSPPPAIPLPPLPATASSASSINGAPMSPTGPRPMSRDAINMSQMTEDQEARIRTIEKHLYAERQLTQTLEEALSDLEKQSKKVKSDCDAWKKRASELEGEVRDLKDRPAPEPVQDNRWSMLQVEEERKKRQAAEAARKQLEERMNAINKTKKKKGSLNCF